MHKLELMKDKMCFGFVCFLIINHLCICLVECFTKHNSELSISIKIHVGPFPSERGQSAGSPVRVLLIIHNKSPLLKHSYFHITSIFIYFSIFNVRSPGDGTHGALLSILNCTHVFPLDTYTEHKHS